MRKHGFFALGLVMALAFLWTACAHTSDSADGKEYKLQGQVLQLTTDRKTANIKHEDIVGFMPAMTMPYKVRDAKEFDGIAPGDLINATLVVVSNDAYLKDVKKVGTAPLEAAPDATPAPGSPGANLLKEGDPVPNAVFLDQDGKKRDFASFKGSAVVLTFIYTRCPMPSFCPLMDRNFAKIQDKLKTDPDLNVHLVSVSFDPETDTPAVLKKHAQEVGANTKMWTFLTGDLDTIDTFAGRFGVSIQRELDKKDPKVVDITHNLRTAIIDREGNLVKAYTGNEWTPEQVMADVKVLVGVD
jgi:protein SCO1/2